MNAPLLSPLTPIADLLDSGQQVVELFIELHVDCIGCRMNKFCTLQDLCSQYELDLDSVIELIEERLTDKARK